MIIKFAEKCKFKTILNTVGDDGTKDEFFCVHSLQAVIECFFSHKAKHKLKRIDNT